MKHVMNKYRAPTTTTPFMGMAHPSAKKFTPGYSWNRVLAKFSSEKLYTRAMHNKVFFNIRYEAERFDSFKYRIDNRHYSLPHFSLRRN